MFALIVEKKRHLGQNKASIKDSVNPRIADATFAWFQIMLSYISFFDHCIVTYILLKMKFVQWVFSFETQKQLLG